MSRPCFIAGDWGTSTLRLSLCDAAGSICDTKSGPGVAASAGTPAEIFSALVAEWDRSHGRLPALLCGMAGSTLGWREAPYLSCPVHPRDIAHGVVRFDEAGRSIVVAPGLSCRNRLLSPDVMRGEETQILGALRCDPELSKGDHVLCLPGTHTKWVMLRGGMIEDFLTGLTGELFDILRRHSILVGVSPQNRGKTSKAFAQALEKTAIHPDADLIHLLFATRSLQLTGTLSPHDAEDYLSGLIIGQDVAGILRLFDTELSATPCVTVIGAPELADVYRLALELRGLSVVYLPGAQASLAGLAALHEILTSRGMAHAS
ncbi:MAG: 2-dehydro-3-deoxygalactonokinase [Rhizomicrobium sp.]|jgi:2-dehydro-3-deoxygalactonokinase